MLLLLHLGPPCINLKCSGLARQGVPVVARSLHMIVAREGHAPSTWLTPNIRERGSGEVQQPECGSRSLWPEDRHFFGL